MKNHLDNWGLVYIGGIFILIILLSIGNWGYCQIRYWNTPWLNVPMHCHFSSGNK